MDTKDFSNLLVQDIIFAIPSKLLKEFKKRKRMKQR